MERLVEQLRQLAAEGEAELEVSVEALLLKEFDVLPFEERLQRVEELARYFVPGPRTDGGSGGVDTGEAARFFSLLLGKKLSAEGLSAEEVTQKFVEAFTTIFDTLNRINTVIQTSLLGQGAELETIRQVIGAQIERVEGKSSVKEYLEKIQEAFLVAHTSFQQAAKTVVLEMLREMDPGAIEASVKSGFRFGPLRKADLFDIYQEKHEVLMKWVESGYFNERLLREFEKLCQRSYRM
ncbi:hypothetical protein EG829_18970 [bacterium]|nr:hypothetical protein [bacterium]